MIKTHKEVKPIRSVINDIQAPSYKLVRHLYKKLNQLIRLPCTYVTKNYKEVAQELSNIQTNDQHKIITLDLKYLYVNIRGLLEKYPTFGREKETGLLGALDT